MVWHGYCLSWGCCRLARSRLGHSLPTSLRQLNCRNGYAGPLVLYLLPLLNSRLIVEMQPAKVFSIRYYFIILVAGQLVVPIGRMIFLSPFLNVIRMSMSTVYFLAIMDSNIFGFSLDSFPIFFSSFSSFSCNASLLVAVQPCVV